MDSQYDQLIEQQLATDEHLLWSGQPNPRRLVLDYLLSGWGATILVALILAVFGVDPIVLAAFSLIVMIIVPLVGLFHIYPEARHTRYALTNRRALIFDARRSVLVQEFGLADIGPIRPIVRKDGSGDLLFASESYRRAASRRKTRYPGFIGIGDVQRVEQLMHDVFAGSSPRQAG